MSEFNAPSLYPETVEAQTPPGRGQHGYYRKTNGWIITAPVWASYRNDMEFKGYDFLSEYGTFVMDMAGNRSTKDLRGNYFSVVDEPWRFIFQRGGAKEFPVEQILAFRWHIRPPYREVKFPQLEGVTVYDYFCPECEKGVFSSQFQQEAIDHLRVHLISRFDAAHSYRPEDLRALGEQYGIDFFAPRRGRRQVVQTAQPSAAPDLSLSEDFICDICGKPAKSGLGLMSHKRTHSVAAPVAVGS